MGGGRVRHARPRDRAVGRAGGDGRDRPARLGRRRRPDVGPAGPRSAGSAATGGRSRRASRPTSCSSTRRRAGRSTRSRWPRAAATRRTPGASCPARSSRPSCAAPPSSTGRMRRQRSPTVRATAEVARRCGGDDDAPRAARARGRPDVPRRGVRRRGETFGEAVFSTGMTGYQETLTDPSLPPPGRRHDRAAHRQHRRQRRGPRVGAHLGQRLRRARPGPPCRRRWRATRTLDDELVAQGVVGISGIDTRALTRHLRDRGAMRVGVSSGETDAARAARAGARGAGDGRRRPGRRGHDRGGRTSSRRRARSGSPSRRSTSASRR